MIPKNGGYIRHASVRWPRMVRQTRFRRTQSRQIFERIARSIRFFQRKTCALFALTVWTRSGFLRAKWLPPTRIIPHPPGSPFWLELRHNVVQPVRTKGFPECISSEFACPLQRWSFGSAGGKSASTSFGPVPGARQVGSCLRRRPQITSGATLPGAARVHRNARNFVPYARTRKEEGVAPFRAR